MAIITGEETGRVLDRRRGADGGFITRRWWETSSPVERQIKELSLPSAGPSPLSVTDLYHGTSSQMISLFLVCLFYLVCSLAFLSLVDDQQGDVGYPHTVCWHTRLHTIGYSWHCMIFFLTNAWSGNYRDGEAEKKIGLKYEGYSQALKKVKTKRNTKK